MLIREEKFSSNNPAINQLAMLFSFISWTAICFFIFWLLIYHNQVIKENLEYDLKLVILAIMINVSAISFGLIKVFKLNIKSVNLIIYFCWFGLPVLLTLSLFIFKNKDFFNLYPIIFGTSVGIGIFFLILQIVFYLRAYWFFAIISITTVSFLLKNDFSNGEIFIYQILLLLTHFIFYFSTSFVDKTELKSLYPKRKQNILNRLAFNLKIFTQTVLSFIFITAIGYFSLLEPIIKAPDNSENNILETSQDSNQNLANNKNGETNPKQELKEKTIPNNQTQSETIEPEEINNQPKQDLKPKTSDIKPLPQQENTNTPSPEKTKDKMQPKEMIVNIPISETNSKRNQEIKSFIDQRIQRENKNILNNFIAIFILITLPFLLYKILKIWEDIKFTDLPTKLKIKEDWKKLNELEYQYVFEYLNKKYEFIKKQTLNEFLKNNQQIQNQEPELYKNLKNFARIRNKLVYGKDFEKKDAEKSTELFNKISSYMRQKMKNTEIIEIRNTVKTKFKKIFKKN